jgi:hypothetical protein
MADFGEQGFLLDFIKLLPNTTPTNTEKGVENYSYEHLMRVEGDPVASINKLLSNTISTSTVFDQFKPHQLSYLTPKIEIWKNKPTGKKDPKYIAVPFPINAVTTADSILNSIEGRGTDVGLTSISWQDTGTDTAYAGITMKGEMKLTFQSFESLFMERPTRVLDEEGNPIMISFAELTTNVPTTLHAETAEDIPKSFYDATIPPFELQLRLGWSVPDDGKNEIFSPGEMQALNEAVSVMNILTNRVNLSIKDGGAVDLTCEFTGRLETAMYTQPYDLFMVDPDSLDRQTEEQDKRLLGDIISNLKGESSNIDSKNSQRKAAIEKNIQIASEELYGIKSNSLTDAWGKFLGKIMSTGEDGRMFYMDLTEESIQSYQKLVDLRMLSRQAQNRRKQFESGRSLVPVDENQIKRYEKKRKDLRHGIIRDLAEGELGDGHGNDDKTAAKIAEEIVQLGDILEKKWTEAALGRQKLRKTNPYQQMGEKKVKRISYFFLGDLFDAAMDIIVNRPTTNFNCKKPVSGKNNLNSSEIKESARLLLGNIYITEPDTGTLMSYSIADLPISVNTFMLWWERFVVAERKTALPLRVFLGQICSHLVSQVLGVQAPSLIGNRRPSSRIKLSVLDMPTGGLIDDIWKNYKKTISINALRDMREKHDKTKDGKKYETAQYIYLYADEKPQPPLTAQAQLEQNIDNGIPHLYVGNNRGIIKKVDFSRTKIQGHLESSIFRSTKSGRAFKSQLLSSDKYDAQIEMFGNPFYKPGLQIYLDPRSLGLGQSVGRQWALDLGLGGLYTVIGVSNTISGGEYKTTLIAKSEVGLGLQKIVQPSNNDSTTISVSEKAGT